MSPLVRFCPLLARLVVNEEISIKPTASAPVGAQLTLQHVLGRLAEASIAETRRRDLRSAVTSYAKLVGNEPAAIPLDLAAIRRTLDRMVPAEADVSAKRWANLRSDLAAAIETSGLIAMLKTAALAVDPGWKRLLADAPQGVRAALSRFARWASLRRVGPKAVDDAVVARFVVVYRLIAHISEPNRWRSAAPALIRITLPHALASKVRSG
jgi:hypothetical protein